ncbi:DNA repair protein RadA [Candidatus Parcubacteria bacterium]|jgi:DNA repair protein RadA/Sms|nr:MAG: DNA repair protein RadA [Candidatus Parcubacteria bacterium]
MKTQTTIYVCSNCDAQFPKWLGRCTECGSWGTIEASGPKPATAHAAPKGRPGKVQNFESIIHENIQRFKTGIGEFDRTIGGGIVPGSVLLLGGEPGIGKSTLALQVTAKLDQPVLYVSGEESSSQVKLRYERLKLRAEKVSFLPATDLPTVLATLEAVKPKLAVIDSIQTIFDPTLPSEAGSIVQVRVACVRLMEVAKRLQIPLILVGHVTKEGSIAGPKVLEHLVDCVLTMEGDPYHAYRLLRTTKNRFGPTDEVGVFDMLESGLAEVPNPSARFLSERDSKISGSAVVPIIEGTRVFLLEIQALVTTTVFGYPRRVASGFDLNRLQLLLAVLTKRAGLGLGNQDVHLNVVGGFKIDEPAADLAVCLAVFSAFKNQPLPPLLAAVGEVGLGGEIRSVANFERRASECEKLGFGKLMCPAKSKIENQNLKPVPVQNLAQALSSLKK